MSKKQDQFYFNNFVACADYASQAAHLLHNAIKDFDQAKLKDMLDQMHKVEHAGDTKKHELQDVLAKAFITPIDRDDIMLLSSCLDNVIDKIEDVLLRMYCNNISNIYPEALEITNVVIQCCDEMKNLLEEFKDFKHSKTLRSMIININTLEEKADELFIANMRKLHTTETDPLKIVSWREIYIYLEKCADACEHVADVVERVKMSNT